MHYLALTEHLLQVAAEGQIGLVEAIPLLWAQSQLPVFGLKSWPQMRVFTVPLYNFLCLFS
jgi:hypothetical protein